MRATRPTFHHLLTRSSLAGIAGGLLLIGSLLGGWLLADSSVAAQAPPAAGATPQSPGKVLRIFAAADLGSAIPALAQNYERETGVKVSVVIGTSEKQVTRLEAGEPADLFLGTDFTYPEKLVADGLTDAKAPIAYAKGTLVLLARKDSALQPLSLDRLEDPRLQKLAIPNPLQAPFGRAAAAALVKLKLMERLEPKLLSTTDATEAAQMVASGAAQLGFVSLSLAKSEQYRRLADYVIVPGSQYPEIRDYAVVLRGGATGPAHHFMDWMLSSAVQTKLPNVGLDPVR